MESRISIKAKKGSHWILEGVVDFGLAAQKMGAESYLGFRFQEGGWGTLVEKLFLLGTAPTRAVSARTHICAGRRLRVAGQLGDLIM